MINVSWNISDLADFNDLFFMVWSSSMKNDLIAIILSHSLASSESNCDLSDELTTEIEWNGWGVQGVTNDPIFGVAIVGWDMWVRMTGVRCCTKFDLGSTSVGDVVCGNMKVAYIWSRK